MHIKTGRFLRGSRRSAGLDNHRQENARKKIREDKNAPKNLAGKFRNNFLVRGGERMTEPCDRGSNFWRREREREENIFTSCQSLKHEMKQVKLSSLSRVQRLAKWPHQGEIGRNYRKTSRFQTFSASRTLMAKLPIARRTRECTRKKKRK